MSLTSADVIRLAQQARFPLSTDEIDRMRADLNAVLGRLAVLHELEHVTEPVGLSPPGVRLRADEPARDALQLPLTALTTDLVAAFFTVPQVIPPRNESPGDAG